MTWPATEAGIEDEGTFLVPTRTWVMYPDFTYDEAYDLGLAAGGGINAVKGTATLDFGAGATEASVDVTGQGTIEADSSVEAWIELADSADHTEDEHRLESIEISAGNIIAGTGFTIYGVCRKGSANGEFNVNWVWAV